MSGKETDPTFRVVGVRENGERVVISTHSTEVIPTKVWNLLRAGDFVRLHIEENPPSNGPNER